MLGILYFTSLVHIYSIFVSHDLGNNEEDSHLGHKDIWAE
jgi:hypothetical protein